MSWFKKKEEAKGSKEDTQKHRGKLFGDPYICVE